VEWTVESGTLPGKVYHSCGNIPRLFLVDKVRSHPLLLDRTHVLRSKLDLLQVRQNLSEDLERLGSAAGGSRRAAGFFWM
jgi:hypothetical protein